MEGPERRLVAIVAADVAGYSRLMGDDEEGTVAALHDRRTNVIDPPLAQYRGRVVNTAGDSLLIEFASAVDALRYAMAIQRDMAASNTDVPEERRLEFRIGVNIGDVVAQGDDLLGDGVNVAARLEELAEPGGICVSLAARDQVRDRLDIGFEDRGEIRVKNIARPVRVFRVLSEGHETRKPRQLPAAPAPQKQLDQDLWVSGLWSLPVAPGIALFAWFIGQDNPAALMPLLGSAAFLACLSIGLLLTAAVIRRISRKQKDTATD